VLKLEIPESMLPPTGQMCSVVRNSVTGRSLEGEAVQLERVGLALPVLSPAAFDVLTDDEAVTLRLFELAAADALSRMRSAAAAGDWAQVDHHLAQASQQSTGCKWVSVMLDAIRAHASGRQRERMRKEATYSASRLRNRLVARDGDVSLSVIGESADLPTYLRRKTAQGKGRPVSRVPPLVFTAAPWDPGRNRRLHTAATAYTSSRA
jgi:hypothetical protein